MEEWKEYKLGTLTDRKIGYGIVQPGASVSGGVPVIKVNNIISGLRNVEELETTSKDNDAKYSRTKLIGGELIISVVGTIGKTAIVPMSFAGCNLVRATCLIDIKDNQLASWVKYYIDSPQGQRYIHENLNTTVQPTLNVKSLVDMPIPMYSSEYMKKVVSILKSLDDKIEVNRKINENLEQQAQALFKSWFVDFEPFKNGEFVESELGMIPKGWRVGRLGEICAQSSIKVGIRNDVKVLSPVTTGKLMLSEEFFIKQVFSENIAKYKVVRRGAFAYNPARVNIGSLGRNEYDFDGAVSPVYVVFECMKGYSNYFDLFRKTERFKTEVLLRAIGGVRQSLNYVDFAMIQTIIAPQNVVDTFNPLFERIKVIKKHLDTENDKLATLRDTLLPKLMSGELKVNEVY